VECNVFRIFKSIGFLGAPGMANSKLSLCGSQPSPYATVLGATLIRYSGILLIPPLLENLYRGFRAQRRENVRQDLPDLLLNSLTMKISHECPRTHKGALHLLVKNCNGPDIAQAAMCCFATRYLENIDGNREDHRYPSLTPNFGQRSAGKSGN